MRPSCSPRIPGRAPRGFSLVELLIVLGVSAVLLVGATALYRANTDANDIQTEIRNAHVIIEGSRKFFMGGSTDAFNAETLIRAGGVPAGMIGDDAINTELRLIYQQPSRLRTRWGGVLAIEGWSGSVILEYDKVSRAACPELIKGLWNEGRVTVFPGFQSLEGGRVDTSRVIPPPAPDELVAFCGENARRTLVFQIYG